MVKRAEAVDEPAEPARPRGRLSRTLAAEIDAGRFPVGSRFPTEPELQARFGVGRHTVRQALLALADDGYLDRRQRSGTVVLTRDVGPRFTQGVGSVEGLLALTRGTTLRIVESGSAADVDDRFLQMLHLDGPASAWQRVAGVRVRDRDAWPLCWSEVYVPERYPLPRPRARSLKSPLFMRLATAYGLRLTSIRQVVRAQAIPPDIAARLGVPAETCGLIQMLKCHAAEAGLFDAAVSIYPGDRYEFSSEFVGQ